MIIELEQAIATLQESLKIKSSTAEDYRKALKALYMAKIDSDNLDLIWQYLIGVINTGKMASYVQLATSAIKSTLRIYGIKPVGVHFMKLEGLIQNREKEKRLAYDEEQIRVILRATLYNEFAGFYSYKTALVLRMTGARVGSLQNLKISDFKNVPGYNDVFYAYVVGKSKKRQGHKYPLLLAKNVLEELLLHSNVDDDKIHNWNAERKSIFRDYVRSNLCYKIGVYKRNTTDAEELEKLKKLLVDRSILHSFRKSYAVQMSKDPALRESLVLQSLLMGHVPNVMVLKAYSMAGETWDSSLERMAEGFSKSSFMTSNSIWEGLRPIV